LTRLILASASEARSRLLRAAGLTFESIPAHIDEQAVRESFQAAGTGPRALADSLAGLKARKISVSHPDAIVIGADQLLVFDGEAIGKSAGLLEARTLLKRLAGTTHALVTASVLAKNGAIVWRHVAHAELTMRPLSDAFLDDYLLANGEDLLGAVGCYRLEGKGIQLFSNISGDYFTILGLPLLPLLGALREFGVLLS